MPHTIYILGNLQTFVAALTGIQMIFNPANNTDWAMGGSLFGVGPLVTIGLLVSMLHITTKGVWTQKLSLHHIGILLGLYAAMFVPTVSVTVQDIYTGQSQIVDGIPDGVAYPAAIVSQMAYDAANQLGQAFQTVNSTQPPTNIALGLGTPLKQMLQLRNMYMLFSKEQPSLARDEVLFVKQCVYPNATFNNWWQQIENSNDILATYAGFSYPSSAYANVPYDANLAASGAAITCNPGGLCYGSCGNMADAIDTAFSKWMTNNQATGKGCGNAAGMATSVGSDTSMPTTDCSGSGTFSNLLSSMGSNGTQYVSMIVNSCINSFGMSSGPSVNALPGAGSAQQDYCTITTNSISQAQVNNAGASDVFLKNMLPLMSILQFLFIALAPLAAFVMVMAAEQGAQTFVKYIMFGLWTQSWLPVAAIINDYAQMTVEHQFAILAAAATASSGTMGSAVSQAVQGLPTIAAGVDALTTTSLPIIIQQTMQILSNADMMLAMTPIITMIVFTGSYFGMAQLAQGIGGEDNVGKNTGLTTPGTSALEKDFGVAAPGNASGTFTALDSAYSGIGASLSSLSSHAESQAIGNVATAQQAFARTQGQAASNVFGLLHSSGVDMSALQDSSDQGSRDVGEAYSRAAKFAHDNKVGAQEVFQMNAEYQAALKLPGATPKTAWASVMESAAGAALGGLSGKEFANIQHAITTDEVQGWSKTLTSSEAAKFAQTVTDKNGKGFDQKTQNKVDESVADTARAEHSVQDAVAHQSKVEETAQQAASMGGSAKLDQATIANNFASRGVALNEANASGFALRAGGTKALDEFHAAREQLKALNPNLEGEALNAAALAKVGMRDGNAGFGMMQEMFGDMGSNPVAQGAALRQQASGNIAAEQHAVDQGEKGLAPAAARAREAQKDADASLASGAAYKQPPKVTEIAPGSTSARDFGQGGMQGVEQEHSGDVVAHKGGFFDHNAHIVEDNIGVKMLNKMTPNEFLGALVGGNAVMGAVKGFVERKAALKAAEGAASKGKGPGGDGGGEPPSAPEGGGGSVAEAAEGVASDGAVSAADQAALNGAREALVDASEHFAEKTAAGTIAAGAAEATGIGAPVGAVIEVANVALNADAAASVAQAFMRYAETPGVSEQVAGALRNEAQTIFAKVKGLGE